MDAVRMCDDSLILLHLPFDQHAEVKGRAGIAARDAISTILQQRNIVPEMCTVCVDANPQSPPIDLQTDMQVLARQLDRNELWVHSACMELFKSVSHEFIYRPFPSTANCDACHKMILVQGYRCKRCLFVFHKSCWDRVPTFCVSHQVHCDFARANKLRDVRATNSGTHSANATDDNPLTPESASHQRRVGIEGQAPVRYRETPITLNPASYPNEDTDPKVCSPLVQQANKGSSSPTGSKMSVDKSGSPASNTARDGSSRKRRAQMNPKKPENTMKRLRKKSSSVAEKHEFSEERQRSSSAMYTCQHCAIIFQDLALYLIHLGYHSFDNPYKCNRCGNVFSDALQFNLHFYQDKHEMI